MPNIPESVISLCGRLRVLQMESGLNQRDFAEICGVSQGYLSDVLNQKSRPSIDMMMSLMAARPDISLDWLWRGDGISRRALVDTQPQSAPMPDELDALASISNRAQRWKILELLEEGPCTLDTLVQVSDLPLRELTGHLILLMRRGSVVRHNDGRYSLVESLSVLRSDGPEDGAQHVQAAVRELIDNVLPVAESKPEHGALVTSELRVKKGRGEYLIGEWLETTRATFAAAQDTHGEEHITLILGVAMRQR